MNDLLDKINIIEVIGEVVELKQRGSNFMGLCPFHNEKTPPFVVSPTRKIYKCFGCGKSGNAVDFLMEAKHLSRNDALRILECKIEIEPEPLEPLHIPEPSQIISELNSIESTLHASFNSVNSLLGFDKVILDYCIGQIEELEERIKSNEELRVTNMYYLPSTTLTSLRNIKSNQSFKFSYETITNQCLVLAVSYFTSSLKELFCQSLNICFLREKNLVKSDTELKFTLEELINVKSGKSNSIGELIVKKKGISFQDMQSTLREFQNYFDVSCPPEKLVHDIILAQASRHAIVHSLSIADEKFISQVNFAKKRTLLKEIELNSELKFAEADIMSIEESMLGFIHHLIEDISGKIN
ncbi:CHC2 zinc finger domain-containing protein [Chitinophaga caseinilytica]|uniref:CHC2 zinc finger domain-containing protein n=1 Tax=Chitinophaga caseinilytica TaxID=2267521 RepID=A0ABZ2Z7N1_9BACT